MIVTFQQFKPTIIPGQAPEFGAHKGRKPLCLHACWEFPEAKASPQLLHKSVSYEFSVRFGVQLHLKKVMGKPAKKFQEVSIGAFCVKFASSFS